MYNPFISVLLPVYNAEKYIIDSVTSILEQTFEDFELLIINDGSTDKSKEIIFSFQDKRIKYIENKNNQGLIKSLNKGLFFSKGQFIARMDADDTCKAERFEQQVLCFQDNHDVDILGTNQYIIGKNEKIEHYTSNEENRIRLLLEPPFAHSSVMMKKESLKKNNLYYDKQALYAEDYKLWIDASLCGLRINNIKEYLCGYRYHKEQVSNVFCKTQQKNSHRLRIGYAKRFFSEIIVGKEIEYLSLILGVNFNQTSYDVVSQLYEDLLEKNKRNGCFDTSLFESFLNKRLNVFTNKFY